MPRMSQIEREREGEGGRGREREGEGEIQRRNKSHGGFDADTLDIPTLLKMEFEGGSRTEISF